MIAEVCRFYGWTDAHVLGMPAARFFSMLKASRKLSRMERVHACVASRAANMTKDDYLETLRWFDDFGKDEDGPLVEEQAKPDPLRGDAAKMAVMRAFAADKRIDRRMKH